MTKSNSLRKKYYRYIVPSIAAQLVFTTYTMIDGLFVARGVSATALEAVNIASPYIATLWAISMLFAIGTSTMTARQMGEGNTEYAGSIFTMTLAAAGIFSVIFSVISLLCAEQIADFLGATEGTREYVITYIRTAAPFSIVYIYAYILEVLVPVDGFPRLATAIVTMSVAVNCLLAYLFIFVLDKGVFGAALATSLAQLFSTFAFGLHFAGRKATIRFSRFRFDGRLILQELYRGLPSACSEITPGLATFIFVHVISRNIGDSGLVAYSATSYISAVLIVLAIGVGQGSQPLISFYNGAREYGKVRQLLKYQLMTVTLIGIVSYILLFAGAGVLIRLFIPGESPEMIEYSVRALRIFVTFCLVGNYNIVLSSYATALEKPVPAVVMALARSFVFLFISTTVLIGVGGPDAVWWGMTVSDLMTLAMAVIIFRRHRGFVSEDASRESRGGYEKR